MSRSTKADKARQLNAAHRLLQGNTTLPQAARNLSREFGLSRRQAYRYLEEAAALGHAVPVVESSVPVTLKIPANTVRALRTYARSSGLTIGEIVARALSAFLGALRRHG